MLTTSVGTEAGQNENLEKELGLVSDHAYSLLACVEVNGVRLCRLRNPWGNTEWLGDWSDNSPLWTTEMKVFPFILIVIFSSLCTFFSECIA